MNTPSTQVSLSNYQIDRSIAQILPEETVRRLGMLPIKIEGEQLQVATTAPVNLPGIDEIKLVTGLKVKPITVAKRELEYAINEQFSAGQTSKQSIVDMTFQEVGTSRTVSSQESMLDIDEAPVVALVNSILRGAINDKASDIHLEPQSSGLGGLEMRVRYRINGLLHDVTDLTVPNP